MKAFVVGVVCLLVGLLVGRMGPSAEVARLEAELAEAGERGGDGSALGGVMAEGLARTFARPPCEPNPAAPPPASAPPDAENEAPSEPPAQLSIQTEDGENLDWDPASGEAPDAEQLDQLLDLAQTRTGLIRQNFIYEGDLDDAQVTRLDTQVESMNEALADEAASFMTLLEAGEPSSTDVLVQLRNMSDILIETGDELAIIAGESGNEVPDEALDPFNWVDPGPMMDVFMDLMEQGQLESP